MQFSIIRRTQDLNLHHPNKIVAMMRTFDGSLTKLIQSLSNQPIILNRVYQKLQPDPQPLSVRPVFTTALQRLVIMRSQENAVCIGRSFWNKDIYEKMMKGREDRPIGLNLIELRVELFKEIEWYGLSSIRVGGQTWDGLQCRSLVFFNEGKPICQIQQYFTTHFYQLFHQ